MALNLPFGIRPINPLPSIDERYGPWSSVAEALSETAGTRVRGLTVGVIENNEINEYWFKDGIDDIHLILKTIDVEGLKVEIDQVGHGLAIGDYIGLSGSTYNLAIADGTYDGEFIGFVSDVVDNDTFVVTQSGYLDNLSGLTTGSTYFLSDTVPGLIVDTPPTTEGYIYKSVLVADSSISGWVLPYVGKVISTGTTNGDATLLDYNIIGDDTTTGFTINHNLNTRNIIIQIYEDFSPYSTFYTYIERDTLNSVYVTFNIAPALGENYKILISTKLN